MKEEIVNSFGERVGGQKGYDVLGGGRKYDQFGWSREVLGQ